MYKSITSLKRQYKHVYLRDDPNRNRLFKIRPIVDYFLQKFQSLPQERMLCVDEKLYLLKVNQA